MVEPSVPQRRPVIVGVSPGQPRHIVEQAAVFARAFGAELICAHVNPGRFARDETADGRVTTHSIDPDYSELEAEDTELVADLTETLVGSDVTWTTRFLAGDVPVALGHLANTVDAAMIVVGTHERSFSGSVQEFFNRSIAVHLAHRQQRPVVVIPSRPTGDESSAPRSEGS